ncbi:MAG: SLBB domain-containing protein, partial [Jaaginema sp. PMC 1079.18]|nr:SLBB domain-containing protein [Jaaginema sp. PMC 1079.18]
YQLPVTSYQLPVTSYQLPITSYQLPVTSYQQPTTNNQQPTTNNQQPTTNNQQPTTNNQQPIAQFPNSPPPISPLSPNAPYTLGVGDSIQVDIFEVPEYTGEYKVLIDGTVNLPIIGRVLVEGLDLNAVSDRLEQQYARYIVDPIITVSLVTARPIDLVVSGEVNRPGAYNVEIDGGSEYPTITEAIELAQGITRSADVEEVEVRRVYQDREQVYKVNLWDVLRGQSFVQDLTLRDGDIVNIPTLTVVDLDNIRQLADSSLAPEVIEPFDVAVVGEVLRPGTYAVNQGGGDTNTSGNNNLPTLTAAVQLAGGITPKADIRNVTLRRQTRRGEEQLIDIDLWQLLKEGDLSQDAILQPGDTIIIPEATAVLPEELPSLTAASFAPNSIRVSIAGEVGDAGVYELPASTTLNQAILSAGGFNPRARRATVELIRLNNDSTVTRQTIPVDFAAGINDDQNPLLLNNDVIVVNRSFIAESSDFLNLLLGPVTSFFTLLNSPLNFLNIFQQN